MDLALLVGELFYSKKTSSVWRIESVDHLNEISVTEPGKLGIAKLHYNRFKQRFESGDCEFIDGPSHTNWGSIVKKDHKIIFDKVEKVFNNIASNTHQWTVLTPTFVAKPTNVTGEWTVDNPLWNNVASRIQGEYKKPNCECGAHKIGAKDYTASHSHWCPVHKT